MRALYESADYGTTGHPLGPILHPPVPHPCHAWISAGARVDNFDSCIPVLKGPYLDAAAAHVAI
jgi:hypothetical protein